MIERHTIDFARVSFNIISDADRATITLQFDQAGGARESIRGIFAPFSDDSAAES